MSVAPVRNRLRYSICFERLSGSVGSQDFDLRAWSGGRRGSTTPGAAERTVASFNTRRREDHAKGIHGGPLPRGMYICQYVASHTTFHECIYLLPTLTAMVEIDPLGNIAISDRDGFYIHGRGPHGSDGCIVPENESARRLLNRCIKASTIAILLDVVDAGMLAPDAVRRSTAMA